MSKKFRFIFLITILSSSVYCQVVAVKDNVVGKEDSSIVIKVQQNDVLDPGCTNETTILITTIHGIATRAANLKDINYTPTLSFYGKDSLNYQIKGCTPGVTSSNWVIIDVKVNNQKPIAKNDTVTSNEDQIVLIDVQANDYDRESSLLSTTLNTIPKHGTAIVPNLDSIKYTPAPNYYGRDTFSYEICDNSVGTPSLCDTAIVYVIVLPVNDGLTTVKSDTSITTFEDVKKCIDISNLVIDVDNENNWTTAQNTAPHNGTATYNNGIICYTPNTNFNGKDSFEVKICDQTLNCTVLKIKVNVTPAPDTIWAVNDSIIINMDTFYTFNPGNNDLNLDNLAFEIKDVTMPLHGFFNQTGNDIKYFSNIGFRGIDSHTYNVQTTSLNYKSKATIYYYIGVSPNKPFAQDDSINTFVNINDTIKVLSNDWLSNLPITFSIYQFPKNVTVLETNNRIVITSPTYSGYDTLYYQICNSNYCDSARVVIKVSNNTKPIAQSDTTILINPSTSKGCLTILDVDTPLTYQLLHSTVKNNLTLDSLGCFEYLYSKDFVGLDSFIVVVCDNGSPMLCDTFVHYISVVGDTSPIQIMNSISPNEDGQNDFLVISNLKLTSNNKLQIINRWGDIVYSKENYDNSWGGVNEKSGPMSGEPLLDGVYFYIFEYEIANSKFNKSGYVVIKK